MSERIDKTAVCAKCSRFIEHLAGIRDPYWRHMGDALFTHGAVPTPGTEKEVPK